MTTQVLNGQNVVGTLTEQGARVYSPNNPPGQYDPGSVTLATETFLIQYGHLKLVSSERLTIAGTARIIIDDHGDKGPLGEPALILGTPKAPNLSFTLPDGYFLDVIARLALAGSVRATLQGSADLVLTDDFKQRSRIVLAGFGG